MIDKDPSSGPWREFDELKRGDRKNIPSDGAACMESRRKAKFKYMNASKEILEA